MAKSRILTFLLMLLCATLLAAGPVAADSSRAASRPAESTPAGGRVDPRLPAPTGVHDVSTRSFHLVDRDRRDPWVGGPRHLMVTMTFPSWSTGGKDAGYMTRRESRALFDFQERQGLPIPEDLPRAVLSRTETGATAGDMPRVRPGGRPLVLLSPGFSLPRSSLTALATDLASRGYVVAQVSHAHEDSGTELPSGRLLRCAACEIEDYSRVPRVRARDLSQVLDHLFTSGNGWRAVLDSRRIGAVGHSIGGNASITFAAQDRRIGAAVNLDGTLYDPVHRDLQTPVMLMGAREMHIPGSEDDPSWDKTWKRLAGDRNWLTVTRSNHGSFTDLPLLTEQLLGRTDPLRGERAIEITRAYVGAFLDRHLRGRDAPILDGPVDEFKEVSHHRAGG